jgi:predicted nucleic acid-binding Zn ribbon protein
MAIKCVLCGKAMPCGNRSCDRSKERVHAPALAKTRPSNRGRVYSLPPRTR